MNAFDESDRFAAPDAIWDSTTWAVKTLSDISSTDFLDKMEGFGIMEINDEQRAEMAKAKEAKKVKDAKKKFSSDAMLRVAEAMRFKDKEGLDLADFNSAASALTDGSHETNGQDTNRSVNTTMIQRNLPTIRGDFNRLMIRLRELSPDDALLSESTFLDDPMETMSLNSSASEELAKMYKTTKTNVSKLRSRLAEIEHGSAHLTGSAGPKTSGNGRMFNGPLSRPRVELSRD